MGTEGLKFNPSVPIYSFFSEKAKGKTLFTKRWVSRLAPDSLAIGLLT
jgi:hypothetical protein